MNFFRDIGIAAWALGRAAMGLPRPSLWGPLFLVTMIQIAAFLALFFFYHPTVVWFAPTVVKVFGGETATHYPEHLFALPAMFRPVNQGIRVLVLSLGMGVATVRYARFYGAEPRSHAVSSALMTGAKLILVMLAIVEVDEITRNLLAMVPDEIRFRSSIIRLGLAGVQLLIVVVVQSLLAYTTAWIVLRGDSIGTAIRDSLRIVMRAPLTTFLLVALPAALLFPFSFALLEMDLSEKGISPEVVATLLGVQILVEFIATFLRVGSITYVFVRATERGL